jgi:predicted dehydrogenase
MNKIRIGILGAGGIAQRHLQALLAHEEVVVTAICDTNPENAKRLAAEADAKATSDFDKLLASNLIDGLYICLPPFAHCGQVERAAQQGIHIFIEKPIALDSSRARSMVEVCSGAGIVSQVGYQNRFGYATQKLKEMIDDGSAGKVTLFDGRYACNSLHSPWWRDKLKSGGQIFEQVIHTYDIAMYFLGKPESVSGIVSNLCHQEVENYTVEDTAVGLIRFKSGALATIASTNNGVPGKWLNSYSVFCENVTVHFEGPNTAEFIYTSEEPVRYERYDVERDLFEIQCQKFIAAIKNEEPEVCPISEGLRSLKLVEGVTKSSKQGGLMLSYMEE